MAHYAFLDLNNVVVKVITGVDETVTQDDNGTPVGGSTEAWEQFYESQEWHQGLTCKRTSYNNNFRGKYARIGGTFEFNRFIPPQPFPSWTLDNNDDWQPPTPYPSGVVGDFVWDELTLSWVR